MPGGLAKGTLLLVVFLGVLGYAFHAVGTMQTPKHKEMVPQQNGAVVTSLRPQDPLLKVTAFFFAIVKAATVVIAEI